MSESVLHRLVVRFEGEVQGVGFRWTAARCAREAGVVGWVRNEADGSVQLVAEGTDGELDALLRLIRSRMEGHIHRERIDRIPGTGEFGSFEISR